LIKEFKALFFVQAVLRRKRVWLFASAGVTAEA
jgi:hypothetical protein